MIKTSFSRVPRENVWRYRQFDGIEEAPRVLIADDHLETAAATGLLLRSEGFLTRSAGTGIDTISLVRSWKPHALILDLSMPLGSGWDVADALRSVGNECLMVAYTGFSTEVDLLRSQRAGFDAYFVKPCDPVRLMRVLFDYLKCMDR
jgi:CheY-like chemotaxis protein